MRVFQSPGTQSNEGRLDRDVDRGFGGVNARRFGSCWRLNSVTRFMDAIVVHDGGVATGSQCYTLLHRPRRNHCRGATFRCICFSQPRSMVSDRRIGVFGGTFDPIHVGHLIIAEILRHRLELAQVIFLPTGRPPHKQNQLPASDHDRLTMLNLSIERSPHFSVSTIDIERAGLSYTSESLTLLRRDLSDDCELYFLMGQDSLRDFPTWHRPDAIARQARLGVALRPGVDVSVEQIAIAVPETRGRVDLVTVPLVGISSRELRSTIREGGPYRFQVVPAVADYISERGLYRDLE
jgi:nicotinate-nucleotide adenylyltransferase